MARKYVYSGEVLDHTPIVNVASGDVLVLGKRIAIALTNITANQTGSVQVEGVWELPKVAADALSQGDDVYWNATDKVITKTASGNVKAGFAAAGAMAGATTVQVKLNV